MISQDHCDTRRNVTIIISEVEMRQMRTRYLRLISVNTWIYIAGQRVQFVQLKQLQVVVFYMK